MGSCCSKLSSERRKDHITIPPAAALSNGYQDDSSNLPARVDCRGSPPSIPFADMLPPVASVALGPPPKPVSDVPNNGLSNFVSGVAITPPSSSVSQVALDPPSNPISIPEPDTGRPPRDGPNSSMSPNLSTTLNGRDSAKVPENHEISPQPGKRLLCVAQATEKLKKDEPEIYKQLEGFKSRPEYEGQLNPEDLLNAGLEKAKTTKEIPKTMENNFRYILQFKDIVAAVTTIDPHKAAPIVWRGFCLILEIVQSFESLTAQLFTCLGESALIREEMIDLGKIVSYFAEWTNFELSHLGTRHTSANVFKELEPKLVILHKEMLRLGVRLVAWGSEGRIVKVIKTPERSAIWKDLVKTITAHHESCRSALERCKAEIDQAVQVKRWLYEPSPEQAHEDALERTGVVRKYRTCGQWLLDDERFKNWSSSNKKISDCRILWLCGTVGTGKSTLICRVIQWHLDRSSLLPDTRFAYFYCSRGTDILSKHSWQSVLLAILRQTAYDPVTGKISQEVQDAFIHVGGPSNLQSFSFSKDCERLLYDILRSSSPRIKLRIMIDALDETCLQALKLLVSSRNDVEVNKAFDNASLARVELLGGVSQPDMDVYIISEVNKSEKHERLLEGESPELEGKLIKILCQRANGMFRWVQLQLSFFLERDNSLLKETVEDCLHKLDTGKLVVAGTKDLNIIYKDIFERRTKDDPAALGYAIKIYRMLLCSLSGRSLTMPMIAEAVFGAKGEDSNVMDARFRRLTADFIVVHDEGRRVEFAHVSVKDYLQSESDYSNSKCNAEAALMCIRQISSDPVLLQNPQHMNTFASYATRFWGYHCSRSTEQDRRLLGVSSQLDKWMLQGSTATTFEIWLKTELERSDINRESSLSLSDFGGVDMRSPIAFSSYYNLVEILRKLLTSHLNLDLHPSKGAYRSEPTSIASGKNTASSIDLANTADENGIRPLHWAIYGGAIEVVIFLLEEADVTVVNRMGNTPLHIASARGNSEIVELLLGKEADVNAVNTYGRTPLHEACEEEDVESVRLLLAKTDNVNATDNSGETPLYIASQFIYDHAVMKLLLENGADPNVGAEDGSTPLHEASARGEIEIMKLLLAKKANLNAVDKRGDTPFSLACEKGLKDIVALLLQKNSDTGTVLVEETTQLSVASLDGCIASTKLLLEDQEAELNTIDKDGVSSPEWWHRDGTAALIGRHKDILELLEKEADRLRTL
ncbi:hypothetical protein VTL71DRAFT_13991 [Oculimacula yallundae]|uniref:Uncharacterized protein n=1 Tax=Oculimacula yallundae TaxID=86028 RepID=A0ABR4CLZ5_9HELO